jgi:hypothetical protein
VFSTLLVIAIVIAIGTRASDNVQVRQQEAILANLPEQEALAYYVLLRRRVRRVAVLRVIAFLSLLTLFYTYKRQLAPAAGKPPVTERR